MTDLLVTAEQHFTTGGNSDSTTMPTSQNQLVTSAPHHSRESLRRCWISAQVEAAMFLLMIEIGRAFAGRGMSKLQTSTTPRTP